MDYPVRREYDMGQPNNKQNFQHYYSYIKCERIMFSNDGAIYNQKQSETEKGVRDHLEWVSVLHSAESSVTIHDHRHMAWTSCWNGRAGTVWPVFVLSPLDFEQKCILLILWRILSPWRPSLWPEVKARHNCRSAAVTQLIHTLHSDGQCSY